MPEAFDKKKVAAPRSDGAPQTKRTGSRAKAPGDVLALTKLLEVTPRNEALYRQALTHKSAETELNLPANERLELLGDAVLDLVMAEHLYRTLPDYEEGDLTKLKAVVVSEPVLALAARDLGLGRFLIMAWGEERTGGRNRDSLLSDAMEAVFAAVYLDRGYRIVRHVIITLLEPHLGAIQRQEYQPDHKTALQEKIQEIHRIAPHYRLLSQEGPDHDRTFIVEARLGKCVLGRGEGKSKKQAEQAAAREALAAPELWTTPLTENEEE